MEGDTKRSYIAALDIGTTTVRCIIFNHLCQIIGSSYTNVKLIYPEPGHVEINPDELWKSIKDVILNATQNAQIQVKDLKSLGISTQRATFISWRKDDSSYLHNFITWKDIRAKALAKELNHRWLLFKIIQWVCYLTYFITRIGKLLVFSKLKFTCSHTSVRLLWSLRNINALKDNVKIDNVMCGTMDTWLLYKFSSAKLFVTDISNACATGLYDPYDFNWSLMTTLLGIPKHILPTVVRNDFDFGTIDENIFGCPVKIGCVVSDQSASLLGSCCFQENDLKVTLGTGGFLNVNTASKIHPSTDGLYPLVAWQLKDELVYMSEAACNDVGSLMQWLINAELLENVEQSDDIAASVDSNDGVYFIPAFSGLGVPINDENAASGFIGIKPTTKKSTLVRAVLESIVFRIVLCYKTLIEQRRRDYNQIIVDGGVSKNNFICQRLADTCGLKVVRLKSVETSARGAAFLVGLQEGFWKNQKELMKLREIDAVFQPTPNKQNVTDTNQWYKAAKRFQSWYI